MIKVTFVINFELSGPPCIPLFGSAPFITVNNFHFYMERVKPKYGPVIGIKIGPTNVVGITGAAEAKEVLKRPEFQGRPTNFVKPGTNTQRRANVSSAILFFKD